MHNKKILICNLLLTTFVHVHSGNETHLGVYPKKNEPVGFLKKLYHGIVPEKVDSFCTALLAGSIISPAIMYGNLYYVKNYFKNNYPADFHYFKNNNSAAFKQMSALIIGGALVSASVQGYLLYNFLHKRTEAGILEYQEVLQNQIDLLQNGGQLTKTDILSALQLMFPSGSKNEGALPLKIRYLKRLIRDIEAINKKLLVLHQPLFGQEIILVLRSTLSDLLWAHNAANGWMNKGKNAGCWLGKNLIKSALLVSLISASMH